MRKINIKSDNYNLLGVNFTNLKELYRFLENNKVEGFNEGHDYFHGGTKFTKMFNGFGTVEELMEMSKIGTDKHTANIVKNKIKVDSPIKVEKIISERRNSYCGGRVSVPRYLDGRPDCMIKNKRSPVRSNILKIAIDVATDASANKKYMIDIGSELINILQAIEKSGYKIEIYSGCTSKIKMINLTPAGSRFFNIESSPAEDTYLLCMTRVKKDNEPFNIRKIAYPIVEPAFFRGELFQYLSYFSKRWGIGVTPDHHISKELISKSFGKDVIPVIYDEMIHMSKEERKGYILDKIRNHCVVL